MYNFDMISMPYLKKLTISTAFIMAATAIPLMTACRQDKAASKNKTEARHTQARTNHKAASTIDGGTRLLTQNEQTFLSALFGADLDVTKIHIVHQPHAFGIDASEGVITCGQNTYSSDFSYERDPDRFCLLFSQGLLLWQQQQKISSPPETGHVYKFETGRHFTDYSSGQQQAIIEDYISRFIHPSRETRWLKQSYTEDMNTDALLAQLVETQFPSAAAIREANAGVTSRELSEQERAFVAFIFGSEVNTDKLHNSFYPQKYASKHNAAILAYVDDPETVHLWKKESFSDDYASEKDILKFGTFIHEITHIWQMQNNLVCTVESSDYLYRIDDRRFGDYGAEQQAAMIEDYARYVLHPESSLRWLPQVYTGKTLIQKRQDMCAVVEDRFPHLKPYRQKLDELRKKETGNHTPLRFLSVQTP